MPGRPEQRVGVVIQRMRSSVLVRNLAAVTGSAALAQAIVFAFSPLITRIYGPEAFGAQGVFLSLISIFTPAIALRYPMAIVIARRETEARHLARLSLQIALTLAITMLMLLVLFRDPISAAFGAGILGNLIYFLPPALFCVALQDVTTFQATRLHRFGLVSRVTIVQAFLINSARVLGGLLMPVAAMLVAVTTIAPSLQALQLWHKIRGDLPRSPRPDRRRITALLRKHREFPVYRVPTDVLNAASQSAPVILLAALFSPATAGLYALTRSVFNLPLNVINTAMGNVLYARFAELARERRPITPLFIKMTLFLLLPAPVIIGVSYLAPSIFSFLFGEEWREAGRYAQWMSIWIAIMTANIPSIRLSPVIKAQRHLLVFNILVLCVRLFSLIFAYYMWKTAISAVILFSVSSSFMNILVILMFVQLSQSHDRKLREPSRG